MGKKPRLDLQNGLADVEARPVAASRRLGSDAMRTILTHRIELQPNRTQAALFRQCVGAARFAYNGALAEWQRQFKAGEKPNEAALRLQFNALKPVEFLNREADRWFIAIPGKPPCSPCAVSSAA